jgi:hypothetical protein
LFDKAKGAMVMSDFNFKVVVCLEGKPVYIEGEFDTPEQARERLSSMTSERTGHDIEEFVFDGSDDIIILNGAYGVIEAWNRKTPREMTSYSHIDFAAFAAEAKEAATTKVIGFQIFDTDGECIQGRSDDPFGLELDDVLIGEAVLKAKRWATDQDYVVNAVTNKSVLQPNFVADVQNKPSKANPNEAKL